MSLAAPVRTDARGDVRRWRRRSLLIRRLRVILPGLIGLILLSMLGFVLHTTLLGRDNSKAEPDAPIELVNPRFVGKDDKGRAFVLTAAAAVRDENDYQRVLLDRPALILDAEGVNPTRVTAKSAAAVSSCRSKAPRSTYEGNPVPRLGMPRSSCGGRPRTSATEADVPRPTSIAGDPGFSS